MHERGRLQRVPGTLVPQVLAGNRPQLVIDQRDQLSGRLWIAVAPRPEQARHDVGGGVSNRGLLGAALAAAFATVAFDAFAGDTKRVVIAERNNIVAFDPATGKGMQAGTFHAAGAISDTGTATSDFTVTPLGGDRALLEGDHVLTSAAGSLVVRSRVTLFPYPSPRVIAQGTWKIVAATGTYAGLQGHGKSLAVGDFTTATATIMRDGEVGPEE